MNSLGMLHYSEPGNVSHHWGIESLVLVENTFSPLLLSGWLLSHRIIGLGFHMITYATTTMAMLTSNMWGIGQQQF